TLATFEWATESVTIVLGSNPTITAADSITFEAGNGIYDVTGQVELAPVTKLISGNFGVAKAPVISSVTATNTGGTAAIEAGDTIEIVFNTIVDYTAFDESKVIVSDGHSLGENATFDWSSDRVTIRLGGNPTITAADSIIFQAGNGIYDVTGQAELAAVTKLISGSFGVAKAP